jgi:hypothetical protein
MKTPLVKLIGATLLTAVSDQYPLKLNIPEIV